MTYTEECNVQQIIAKRGSKRYIGLYFRVKWEHDDNNTWEPVCNFICLKTKTINGMMLEILKDYRDTAMIFPHLKRRCITCNRSVSGDRIFCKSKKCNRYKTVVYFFL